MKRLIFMMVLILFPVKFFAQNSYVISVKSYLENYFRLGKSLYVYPITGDLSDTLAYFYIYKHGFLVLSAKKDYYPLKSYSTDANVDTASYDFESFIDILRYDYELQKKNIEKNKSLANVNNKVWDDFSEKFEIKSTIGPLLKSEYGQVNCKDDAGNYIYVTNYYTPNHYAVGCVALALTEVLRYYNWPIHGSGYHSYTDNYGSSNGSYSADYENTTYKWSNIQDKYYNVESSEASREALGRVAFDAAVSVDMDFEYDGSTSNINRVPLAVSKYFRYEKPLYLTSSQSGFWNMIDSSLTASSPVQLAVYTSSGAGHAVVCDGLQYTGDPSTQLYHLNMGWWGSSNGWYTIQSDFNAGGYSIVSAAVMGMLPVPEINDPVFDLFSSKIKVSWYYSPKVSEQSFVLEYRHDGEDWQELADNITDLYYEYPASTDEKVYFRVRQKNNTLWSDEVYINTATVVAQLDSAVVFPSPATTFLNLRYKDLTNATFVLYNQAGKKVLQKSIHTDAFQVEVSLPHLPSGLYFGQLITPEYSQGFKLIISGANIN